MSGTPAPSPGQLLPTPATGPRWRRGSWPWWVALVLWLLLFVRELPTLVHTMMGGSLTVVGGPVLAGLVLLFGVAIGVAALAPGRLTAQHLGLVRPKLLDVVIWSAVALAALYSMVWLGSVISGTPHQDTSFGMGHDVTSDVMLVLGIGTIGPVAEEFAYRATLFRALSDALATRFSPRLAGGIAVAVSSLIFMMAHTGAPPWHQAAYFLFAAVLALGYWRTGSLYVAVVPHLLNNMYATVTMAQAAGSSLVVVALAALGPLLGLGLTYGVGKILTRSPDTPSEVLSVAAPDPGQRG